MSGAIDVISAATGPSFPATSGESESYVVVGPHSGAEYRTMAVIRLIPDDSSSSMTHPDEAVWYVTRGSGAARPAEGEALDLDEGSMVHVEPGASYSFEAGSDGVELIGGPAPPDPELGTDGAPRRDGARVRPFHRDRPAMKVPMISNDARLVVFPGWARRAPT